MNCIPALKCLFRQESDGSRGSGMGGDLPRPQSACARLICARALREKARAIQAHAPDRHTSSTAHAEWLRKGAHAW